uniref:Large ribosomal subunit protein uL6 alpha-beta domain-containing protein n=1 Tax=Pinguiococcus pyrenoidosus TaxID=172671 RepID=A0A7R9YBB6_9STRA|mmetsp:Transcript_15517/g.58982  ORF Transcript_15517/g.58982 Transcript_15517/m.58982 type:complete len:189 (+) Transcript_15517:82-648(+)
MRQILSSRLVSIPEGVTVEAKCRTVTVSGPRGELTRKFGHLKVDMQLVSADTLKVDLWFGTLKQRACIRTVCSHIENMITGVTKGFLYKMRFCYAHFPIIVAIEGRNVEIRNFLGEKRVRKVALMEGVDALRTESVKDQIELSGNDIVAVSLTAARIQQATRVRNKDIRKFLDGIYVSEKGTIVQDED